MEKTLGGSIAHFRGFLFCSLFISRFLALKPPFLDSETAASWFRNRRFLALTPKSLKLLNTKDNTMFFLIIFCCLVSFY